MNCGPGTSKPANTYASHGHARRGFFRPSDTARIYLFIYFRYPVANYIDEAKRRGLGLPMSINQSIEMCSI
jgi:hypothetical protein